MPVRRNYQDPVYKDWRRAVYKRDKNRCRMPGCKSRTKLQAHHIRRWADASTLRYDICNGITLCRACHDSINGKESHYEVLFSEIVNTQYG